VESKRGNFTSRDLALVAGMSALYLGYGYVSGVTLGHTIREVDLFFLISVLFTVLVSLTRKHWIATILGTVTGLILVATPGAPLAVTLALIPNGIVFDLTLRAGIISLTTRHGNVSSRPELWAILQWRYSV
jgi:hypothetical protein